MGHLMLRNMPPKTWGLKRTIFWVDGYSSEIQHAPGIFKAWVPSQAPGSINPLVNTDNFPSPCRSVGPQLDLGAQQDSTRSHIWKVAGPQVGPVAAALLSTAPMHGLCGRTEAVLDLTDPEHRGH